MGWNTTVLVLNDALEQISKDKDFGSNLSKAISECSCYGKKVDISAGYHCNAATVIESHHMDETSVIAVGGNTGINLGTYFPYGKETFEIRVLRELANKYGFELHKKRKRK